MGDGEGTQLFSGSASVAVLTPEPLSYPRTVWTPVTLQFPFPPASFARVVSASTLTALQPATRPLVAPTSTPPSLRLLVHHTKPAPKHRKTLRLRVFFTPTPTAAAAAGSALRLHATVVRSLPARRFGTWGRGAREI